MRRYHRFFFGIIGAVALLVWSGITACDRLPTQPQQVGVEDEEIANVLMEDLEIPDPEVKVDISKGDVSIQHSPRFSYFRLGCILRKLRLTREQWDSVKVYLREYRLCTWEVRDSVRRAARPILEEYRQQFLEILQQYRNGEIDRDSLFALIRELRQSLVEAFSDLRQWAREQMENCRSVLFESIRSILTDEQRDVWDEWVDNGGRCGDRWRWDRDRDRDRDHDGDRDRDHDGDRDRDHDGDRDRDHDGDRDRDHDGDRDRDHDGDRDRDHDDDRDRDHDDDRDRDHDDDRDRDHDGRHF